MTEDLPDWGWGARLPKAARHQMLHPSASERVGRRLVTQSKSDSSKRHFLAHLGKIAAARNPPREVPGRARRRGRAGDLFAAALGRQAALWSHNRVHLVHVDHEPPDRERSGRSRLSEAAAKPSRCTGAPQTARVAGAGRRPGGAGGCTHISHMLTVAVMHICTTRLRAQRR